MISADFRHKLSYMINIFLHFLELRAKLCTHDFHCMIRCTPRIQNLDTPRRSGCGEWHGPHRNISHPRCGLLHKSSFTCGASCVASKRTHYCLSGSRTMVKIVQIRSIFDIFATHSANLIKHGRGNFRVGQAFIVMKIYLRYFQGKHCGIML